MGILDTTSTRNDENKIELTVTLTADEVQKHINAAYKEAGKVRIPGFRPGKAPRRVLENHYGGKGYFQAQATDELVKETLPIAIDREGHVPLDQPDIPELELVEEGKEFSYKVTFTVRPVYELSSYDPIQIELPDEEPTSDEIDAQINIMLDYYSDFESITDRPAQEGDYVTLDMELSIDGERFDALSGDNIPYELGCGQMTESFDKELFGAKIDETREFSLTLSPEQVPIFEEETTAEVVAKVKGIQVKTKPELTDDFAKETLEFENAAEFKERIAESIRAQKQSEIASLKQNLIVEELASRLEGEPSELIVTSTEQGLYRDFFNSLQQNNQTFDAFLASTNMTPETFRESIHKQAHEFAAQALALDAFAVFLGTEITEADLREEFASSGTEDPDALYDQWERNGRLSEVREGLLRMKATRHINENVEVFAPGKKPKKAAAKKSTAKKAATKADKAADASDAKDVKTDKAAKLKSDKSKSDKAEKPAKSTGKEPSGNKTAEK